MLSKVSSAASSFCTPRSPAKNSARATDFDRLRRLTFALPLDLEFVFLLTGHLALLNGVFGGADQDRRLSGFIPSGVSIVQVWRPAGPPLAATKRRLRII